MEVYTTGKRWAGAHQIPRTSERRSLARTAVNSLAQTELRIEKSSGGAGILNFVTGSSTANLTFDSGSHLTMSNLVSNKDLRFGINKGGTQTEVVRIEGQTSNVGIGLTDPFSKLHVDADAVASGVERIMKLSIDDAPIGSNYFEFQNLSTNNAEFSALLRASSSTTSALPSLTIRALADGTDSGSEPIMVFDSRQASTSATVRPLFQWRNSTAPQMTMLVNGHLGIGITTPSGRLHVNGTVFINYGSIPASSIPNTTTATEEDLGISTGGQLINLSTSSIHYKENVENIEFDKEAFLSLRPVDFKWKEFQGGHFDVGLIAQEVAEIFPPLASWSNRYTHLDNGDLLRDSTGVAIVDTSQKEVSGVRYHKLPVYLLSIVKDQQQTILNMQEQLEDLTALVDNCCNRADGAMNMISGEPDTEGVVATPVEAKAMDMPVLSQNAPNPFNENTVIKFYLPKHTKGASIKIFDATGTVFRLFTLNGFGSGSISIEANTLAPGNYHYSLLMDGYVADTKTMLVTY